MVGLDILPYLDEVAILLYYSNTC